MLKEPLESDSGFRLEFDLVQNHGGANNNDVWTQGLGRFRISVTDAKDPMAQQVPREIYEIIA